MPALDSLSQEYEDRGLDPSDIAEIRRMSGGNLVRFHCALERRYYGETMSYIAPSSTFFGREFLNDRRAYTSNPETEQMVQMFIDEVPENETILEAGTGRGNIAITVALTRPDLRVYATELVDKSLELAEENRRIHGAQVTFMLDRYVDYFPFEVRYMIADLPYGDKDHMLSTSPAEELPQAPPESFFHPDGPLAAYEGLIASIMNRGWHSQLYFETGPCEKEMVAKIMPKGHSWKYIPLDNYSVTKLRL
ncbi:MAG: hypothetical protein ABH879_06040 [archaeon]